MIQTYDMIFWARPHELDIDEMTDVSYRILKELEGYGEELAPKYLPGKKKADTKEFNLERENVKELLEKNVNKEGDTVFLDLARHVGFFSSLKDELASNVSIRVGNRSPLFSNTVVIKLPYGNFSGFDLRRDDLESLFKRIIPIFNPYFAFIANSFNNRRLSVDRFCKDDKPTYVHWLNYYDKATAEAIGIKKFLELGECEPLGEGYFLKLQDVPINVDNLEHMELQRRVSMQLGLL